MPPPTDKRKVDNFGEVGDPHAGPPTRDGLLDAQRLFATQLLAADAASVDDVILGHFGDLARALGLLALGECDDSGPDACWYDSEAISDEELSQCASAICEVTDLSGMVCTAGPGGRVLYMAPTGHHAEAVLVGIGTSSEPFDQTSCFVFETMAGLIGVTRARFAAERALTYRLELQSFLSSVSTTAAVSDDENIVEWILGEARAFFDIGDVSTWTLDGQRFELTANVSATGLSQVELGVFVEVDAATIDAALEVDHLIVPISFFSSNRELLQPSDSEVLAVPLVSSSGLEGALVFTDPNRRRWSSEEIVAANSIARSVVKAATRQRLEAQAATRVRFDRVLSQIVASSAHFTFEDEDEFLTGVFSEIIDQLGVSGGAIWDRSNLSFRRRAGLLAGKMVVGEGPDVGASEEWVRRLDDRGYGFFPRSSVGNADDIYGAEDTILLVPLRAGESAGGLLALIDPSQRRWSAEEISRVQSVAHVVGETLARFDADREVAHRLAAGDLLRSFATRLLTTASTDQDGAREALVSLVGQFGIDHAVMWHSGLDAAHGTVELALDAMASEVADPPIDVHHVQTQTDHENAVLNFDVESGDWSLEEAPAELRVFFGSAAESLPRRVGLVGHRVADEMQKSHIVVTRPGLEPFGDHVLDLLRAALRILRQHEARVTAERTLATVFESAPLAISIRDAEMKLIACNGEYVELTGRSELELIGTGLDLVIRADQLSGVEADFDVSSSEVLDREAPYLRSDGSIVWTQLRSTPVVIPGRRGRLLLTFVADITDQRRSRQLLEYQASHDELTGLANRRSFVTDVATELGHTRQCAVLVLDLDRFKVVNDSLGHSVGDQLLVTCADRIRLSLRPGDTVCRLGGDEFAILLRAPADSSAVAAVADRLLSLLREPVQIAGEEVFPSASIGIAIPDTGDAVEDLLRHADAAMYQAKGRGRDRWTQFDRSLREAVVERVRTETDLRRAIENGQLDVHYQPEFMLETGEIVGVEALVRWHHPERGLLTAGSFIALAEETGLVVDLGRWVLGQATVQGATWVNEGHDIIMRVNLSARQLRPAVVGEVEEALAAAGLAPERLCLELTETAIMDDVQQTAQILQQFRDLGVQVAIDDFGTGFSSLAYLKRFAVDILKIDRTFVDGVGVDPDDTAIVSSIIGLARSLRLEVVAEGIEDPTQVAELVRLGCQRGQGFHLARPAPPEDVGMILAAETRKR